MQPHSIYSDLNLLMIYLVLMYTDSLLCTSDVHFTTFRHTVILLAPIVATQMGPSLCCLFASFLTTAAVEGTLTLYLRT
jgi:hypothetical protein